MANMVNWFEIPVEDLNRAVAFYKNVFQVEFDMMETEESEFAMFKGNPGEAGATGALMKSKGYTPRKDGVLIYLSCEDLDNELKRIEDNNGEILRKKTSLGPHGFMAEFIDSEGNRLALHSMK